jgi:hypothetical protein
MTRRRVFRFLGFIASAILAVAPLALNFRASAQEAPHQLTNEEFWKLVSDYSEPDGTFHSENLVSNEARYQLLMAQLVQVAKPGRAYLGVGSEQNFNYMVAVKPDLAFIVDIRRGNLDLHLMYKALFELSSNRVEFISRLFSIPPPSSLTTTSTVAQIFAAYQEAPSSLTLYTQNLIAISNQLVRVHGFGLASNDYRGIEYVFSRMYTNGPNLRYELTTGTTNRRGTTGRGAGTGRGAANRGTGNRGTGNRGGLPTYAGLMVSADETGRQWSYLASEDSYRFLKDFETRNLLVPVVGNFGGSKALRDVATYLTQKREIVSVFYTSNVEQYLRQDNIWTNFCDSVTMLPTDSTSTFIRSTRSGLPGGTNGTAGFNLGLQPIAEVVRSRSPSP